jgi:hypothetical protein
MKGNYILDSLGGVMYIGCMEVAMKSMAGLVVNGVQADEDGAFWCVMCQLPAGDCYKCEGCGCPTDREVEAALEAK